MWTLPSTMYAECHIGPARFDVPDQPPTPWRLIAYNNEVAMLSIVGLSFPTQPTVEEMLVELPGDPVFRLICRPQPGDMHTAYLQPNENLARVLPLAEGIRKTGLFGAAGRRDAETAGEILFRFGVGEWPDWRAWVERNTPPGLVIPPILHQKIGPAKRDLC